MVLGGYGEVGYAISRQILQERPRELIVASLRKEEALLAVGKLRLEAPNSCKLISVYGNLFTRFSMKDVPIEEIITGPQYQQRLAEDVLQELTEEILTSSVLYQVILQHRPEIIVDCINTATALAYKNLYQSCKEIFQTLQTDRDVEELTHRIYQLLSTLYIPPLIRHIQILYEAMKRAATLLYLKIGTTGTGGMGFDIPFTHGEENPSRLLLSKAAVAGAQTLLLFSLGRTLGGPVVKEIKPAALIGWKGIGRGRISKGESPIPLYDCPLKDGCRLIQGRSFSTQGVNTGLQIEGEEVKGVYVDTGENGVFSLDEFKVVTGLSLMEYITPEEIAQTALLEIKGINTSKDVLGAIAGAVMESTYRAGLLRQRVINEMESLGQEGIAYGLLGPRIAKLIFEAHLIKRCYGTLEKAFQALPAEMSEALVGEVEKDQEMRRAAISQGIPILLPDGETLLFANRRHRDKGWEKEPFTITTECIEKWASQEWIDLRPQNMSKWQERFRKILEESKKSLEDTSSRFDRGREFLLFNEEGEIIIDPGEVAGWILVKEK